MASFSAKNLFTLASHTVFKQQDSLRLNLSKLTTGDYEMKTIKKIFAVSGLVMGFVVSNSVFAANTTAPLVSDSNQRIQQYRAMVSTDTMLKYGNILLHRSSVAKKLKFSSNPVDSARYNKALDMFKTAEKHYQAGDEVQAKKFALESIRVIARAVPQYYTQTANAD